MSNMTINLKEAADLIATIGHEVTVLLQGEPGVGKSALLNTLKERFPSHDAVYIDCTTKDLGDFFMPQVVEENGHRVVRFVPNAQFMVHTGRPAIICFDELGKTAMRSVQNAVLPILHERRVGDARLHPQTIVFATTNLSTDGVGDQVPAHARNRMCSVTVRKPTAGEWLGWADRHGVAAEICAFVKQFPHVMASYTDSSQKDNPYIYQPSKSQLAFVTPRSLEKASAVVKGRALLGHNATANALAGLLGPVAAADMTTFLTVADALPTLDSVTSDPEKAKVPADAAAIMVLIFGLLRHATTENLAAIMTYLRRLPKEAQSVFFEQALMSDEKTKIFIRNAAFKQWATANSYLY